MEAPLISATRAEIICPGHPLTANTAWPAGQQLTKKVQLAGQPTPTPRRVKPSSPSLQQRSCAFSDHKNSVCASLSSSPGLERTSESIMLSQGKRGWELLPTEMLSHYWINLVWEGSRIPSTIFEYRNLQTCWKPLGFFSGFYMIFWLTYFLNNLVEQILFLHIERAKCSLYTFAIAYLSLKM